MTHLLNTLGEDAVLFAFWCAVLFMVGYTAVAKWWKSEIGWARISLDFGIALALSPTMIHVVSGARIENSVGFAWYQIGAIAFVGFVSLWNLALAVRTQMRHWKNGNGSSSYRNPGPQG